MSGIRINFLISLFGCLGINFWEQRVWRVLVSSTYRVVFESNIRKVRKSDFTFQQIIGSSVAWAHEQTLEHLKASKSSTSHSTSSFHCQGNIPTNKCQKRTWAWCVAIIIPGPKTDLLNSQIIKLHGSAPTSYPTSLLLLTIAFKTDIFKTSSIILYYTIY